jgi:SAM-dependent methyltransferase
VPDFVHFDQRHYRTVSVRDGYRDWVPSYEQTVEDEMDLALLERIETVDWSAMAYVADLGCGTGRTGAWLKAKRAGWLVGVDATPEMLDVARRRGSHDRLVVGDVRATSLAGDEYDLVICCLVDEHLPHLGALYHEARRLLRDNGRFVLVGFHPFFIMRAGMPTHFDGADGEPVAVETFIHLFSEHFQSARDARFTALELHERTIDDAWLARKPQWEKYRGWPISFAWVWTASAVSRHCEGGAHDTRR